MSDLNSKHNRVVWLDIPVADLGRACAFYEGVLAVACHREKFEDFEFAVLDHDQGNGACLMPKPEDITDPNNRPGPMVYFNADGRIRDALAKVTELGGAVIQEIHAIGPHGFRAVFTDSEGNRFALHSNTDA